MIRCEARLTSIFPVSADLRPTDIVMDLFCGTGSIGLTLAKHCQHVYGFEVAVSSIADAKRNAVLNHITNATFVGWDLTKVSASMGKQYPRPDVIVTGKDDFVITFDAVLQPGYLLSCCYVLPLCLLLGLYA